MMELDLAGYRLSMLQLGLGAIRLGLARGSYLPDDPTQPAATITSEQDFELASPSGRSTITIDDWGNVQLLLPLVGQELLAARASDNGRCHIVITHDARGAPWNKNSAPWPLAPNP